MYRSWQVCAGALGAFTGEQCWQLLGQLCWQALPAAAPPAKHCSLCLSPWLPLKLLCSPGLGDCAGKLCPAAPHLFCPAPGSMALWGTPSCHCSWDIYGHFSPIQRAGRVTLPAQQHFLLHVQQQDFLGISQELWNRSATSIAFIEHETAGQSLERKPKQDRAKVSNSNMWLWIM